MIYALVILAQLTLVPPPAPPDGAFCDESLIETTVKLDDGRMLTISREPMTGRPIRAVVRRFDGKPMTCDPYFAWVSHKFRCDAGDCNAGWYQANGVGGGTTRQNACINARDDGCAQTACSPGTYQYCEWVEGFSGIANGSCVYQELHTCWVQDDCSQI